MSPDVNQLLLEIAKQMHMVERTYQSRFLCRLVQRFLNDKAKFNDNPPGDYVCNVSARWQHRAYIRQTVFPWQMIIRLVVSISSRTDVTAYIMGTFNSWHN